MILNELTDLGAQSEGGDRPGVVALRNYEESHPACERLTCRIPSRYRASDRDCGRRFIGKRFIIGRRNRSSAMTYSPGTAYAQSLNGFAICATFCGTRIKHRLHARDGPQDLV